MKIYFVALLILTQAVFVLAQQAIPSQDFSVSRSQIEDFGQTLGAAEISAARPISRLSLEMIKDFEHWMPSAYDDPSSFCTIGYGHLIALKRCDRTELGDYARPLTLPAGEDLLEKDTTTARLAIQKLVKVDLSDDQFGALVSFVFNIGKSNFKDQRC